MKRSPLVPRLLSCLPRLRASLAAAALCALGGAAQASVLILGATGQPGGLTDVQSKIAATGVVSGTVDVFNANTGTPTLALLKSYDAVLVFNDTFNKPFASATQLGNVLADYVDAGGGVVEAGLSHATIPFGGLTGRFVTGGYDVFNANNNQNSCGSLGRVADPQSPLMRDIDSFSGGLSALCYRVTPKAGASVVAYWTNDKPLLGYRTDHKGIVVGLNMFPVSGDVQAGLWDSSTDGARLMANSLAFAAGELPEPGSLALLGIAAVAAGVAGRRRARRA
ncbi:PEP-CTERM protein-sorting domain-containing protein [Mitsuaria sp. PDC51]|uniref:PEP-CTERM sorting domain-containing protein n=2 Tax=unclassified Roseateles TaxID=2626991 RepID=UPI0008EB91C8|nr:PEP-CTERM sorting domain-containing protein [Mitsuaria sp. PDC51]SFS00707.1 PEP-CTERM protein-sorting domain-containing protein [Mitsuaria sp. PDC51]